MLYRDFIINAGMLIAFISICYQIFGNVGFNTSLSLRLKLGAGILFGLLGTILIEFSVRLPNNLLLDFRALPIIIASLSAGFIPGIVASIIIAFFRTFRFGVSHASIFAAAIIIMIALISHLISRLKIKLWQKWVYCTIVSEILVSIAYTIFITDLKEKIFIISANCIVSSLISLLLYIYVGYLEAYTYAFRRYKQEANVDFLTGLNNVRQFDTIYNSIIEKVTALNKSVSLLFVDIDFFKKVNDTYGHKEGDVVLKKLGEILIKACRSIDIVSRNGGEEFSVVLVDCTTKMAMEIAERIRTTVEATPFNLSDNKKINITVSIGVASYPDNIEDLSILKEKSDEALYLAKRSGRNKVVSAQ